MTFDEFLMNRNKTLYDTVRKLMRKKGIRYPNS